MKKILPIVLVLALLASNAFALIGTNSVWWITSTAPAGNTSGGGFDTGATFASNLAATSANTASPSVTSTTYTFTNTDTNQWLYIASTNNNWTPGWYFATNQIAGALILKAGPGDALQFDNTRGTPYKRFITNSVAGCATVASPTSGTWSMDYSKSDTVVVNGVSDLTIDGTVNTKVTSATRTFGTNDVGNMIHTVSGTGWNTAGYYEIISVAGGAATLDRSPSAAANANKALYYYGAASSLGSSTAGRTDTILAGACTPGNRYLIKSGTYTVGGSISFTASIAAIPTIIEGYQTTPGDEPTGSNMPLWVMAANVFTLGTGNEGYNLSITGNSANVAFSSTSGNFTNCKIVNDSTTAGRIALVSGSSAGLVRSEVVCYRGIAVSRTTGSGYIVGNYIHDSDIGFSDAGSGMFFVNNIFADNATAAIKSTVANNLTYYIHGNTFYGAENKLGTGIILVTGSINPGFANNIFYGLTTGITQPDIQQSAFSDYSDWFNNTTDFNTSNWQYGKHDLLLNPTFANITQRTGSTATTTAGNHLVQSGATFQTWGITAGTDCLYLVSGTGPTSGIHYSILSVDSETQITTGEALTANATADKVWQITQGHNFAVGTNMKAVGFPGAFQGGLTTGYTDIGAVQRIEPTASTGTSGGAFTFSQ